MGLRLPTPPSDSEKYLYVDQDKKVLYGFGVISMLLLVTGMTLFSISHPYTIVYLGFTVIVATYLGISYFIGIFGGSFDLKDHVFGSYKLESFPPIDVFLPSCGEDLDVIKNTMRYVKQLDYPGEVKAYVLDDCKDPGHNFALRRFSQTLGFEYIGRPNKGELKKSGNVRYAFQYSYGKYILILDADFCPRSDFLLETVPYLEQDNKIAIVQTPQFFDIHSQDSWVQKGASYIQELFYRLVQVNRNKWSASICVGTCALYRRSALEPHGGTAAIGFSEDVHTGFQAIKDGYKIKYIPINLSKGLCPPDIQSFLIQQYRWATGSLTLFMNKDFWTAKLPVIVKMNYLSGMLYYLVTGISLLLSPLPSIIVLTFFPDKVFYYNIVFSFPSFLYGTIAIALWTRAPWGLYAIQARTITYWSHLFAIIDKVRDSTVAWVATGASGKTNKVSDRFFKWFYVWNILSLTLILSLAIHRIATFQNYYDFLPTIIFTSLHAAIFISIAYKLKSSIKN